jgi:redox-sensing transcriptional repressor
VADLLVRASVTSLLNFAPRVLHVPSHVQVRYVDLSIELQVLGFYRARQDAATRSGERDEPVPLIRAVGMSPPQDLA